MRRGDPWREIRRHPYETSVREIDRVRVLVTTDAGFGGAERVVFALARHAAECDVPVHVVMLAGTGELLDRLQQRKIPCTALQARSARAVSVSRLERLLEELHPALIHAHLHHANRLCQRTSLVTRVPLITTEHAVDPRFLPHRWFLERRLHPRSRAVVCVSACVASAYAHRVGVPADTLHVIAPGLTPPITPSSRSGAIRRLGFLGRLEREKGIDVLLRAFPQGPPDGIEFAIAGTGRWKAHVERWARRHPSSVQLHGFVADVDGFLSTLDALIVPSRTEGFGLSAAEALARGVPVLLADLPALRELLPVTQGFEPFFHPTPNQLRAAVDRLLERGDPARADASKRREGLVTALAESTMFERWDALYARQKAPGKI